MVEMTMIIPQVIAMVLFFLIPFLFYGLTIVIVKYSDGNSPSKFRRWLHAARKPLDFKSLSNEAINQVPEEERSHYVTKEVVLRLVAIYLIIGVFLLSNIVGSFYAVMADVLQNIGNAGSSDVRTWTSIVFTTPFSGGWAGSFPWYGYGMWPPSYLDVYHEPWNWVFHSTALVTGNPYFFQELAEALIIIPLIVGVILLLPLARRSVREAFLPSIIHLNVSLMVIVSSLFNCFAEAFNLAVLLNPITYGQYIVENGDLNGLPSAVLVILLPVLSVIFLVFLGISYKLARTHYSTSSRGRWLFVGNTALLYWVSFVLILLV